MLEVAPGGFEETESSGWVELAAYTDCAGEERIRTAFSDVSALPVAAGWEDRWKEFHHPVWAGGLWIGPPWLSPPADQLAVVVDPGLAFGTGAHATTRACIELLSALERGSLLDAGCGSGVVAAAAALLGFAPILAVDLDEVAVGVAAATVSMNQVDVEVAYADVLLDQLPASDVVVANIELAVVEQLLARVHARIAVTSGYLASQRPTAPGWLASDRLELDGWAADVFVRAALS